MSYIIGVDEAHGEDYGAEVKMKHEKGIWTVVSITYHKGNAQQNMHWTAGIVRRFKQFSVVKFILSLWHSLASRQ